MESHGEESDFTSAVENLVNMFGHVMTREVIATLVESCDGDLNLSVDAIMKITNDGNAIPNADEPSTNTNTNTETPPQQSRATTSYAAQTSLNKGAIPRQLQPNNKIKTEKPIINFWSDQIRKIMAQHNKGARIMIIMRGLPGSGKSFLSKLLIESMIGSAPADYKTHIFSTDDYFMFKGQYQYDRNKLSNAHCWNQNRVRQVTAQGLSPVIVDNTNVEVWEMHPYVGFGVANGYIIEVVEPNTPWAKKTGQLFKKSTHNVPLNNIKRMLDNFAEVKSSDSLLRSFRMSYPAHMIPPVMRLIPPVQIQEVTISTPNSEASLKTISTLPDFARSQEFHLPNHDTTHDHKNVHEQLECSFNCGASENREDQSTENLVCDKIEEQVESNVVDEMDELTQEEQTKQNYVQEALKRLEELEKFEEEWENGEQWEEADQIAVAGTSSVITKKPAAVMHTDVATASAENIMSALVVNLESKPPRNDKKAEVLGSESASNSFMQSVNNCQDWRDISLFLPSWEHPDEQPSITPTQEPPIEMTSSSTRVEMYDTLVTGKHKVITATPRDINEYYIPPEREKIPEKRMLDKSTTTDEGKVMIYHCPQKERHFVAFRKLFKKIERESLRYIFDNCCGDANWAVENILGGGVKYKLKSREDDNESESEEESDLGDEQHCNCMAQYGITPNASKLDSEPQTPQEEVTSPTPENTVTPLEKKKRDATVSEENMQLKRQIEQNVVISDSHYSDHCLKIRKFRRGEHNKTDNSFDQPSTSGVSKTSSGPDVPIPTAPIVDYSDDDDDGDFCGAESDRIINMNMGKTFISNLDDMFGRKGMEYPENILYNISIPNSLLNAINALWMESMMFQLDENAKRSQAMIKQDEEFARQLEMKEAELLLAGKEQDVPDFKEIMDLEFSLSLSLKDSTEWRKHVPTDIAAKMTHEKLYTLFPEIDKDILLEMLMAHDNNFKSTVEVLLTSTGRTDVIEQENGLTKYMMARELERKDKILQEERETSESKSEFPALDENIDIATVQKYRDEAEKHLNHRNMHMLKAEDYIRRGMTQVANYWSDLANFHRTRYEQANSKAVALLMQYHANNNQNGETVDLHYFRVKEAKEAMDLFIDTHIQRLKEKNKRSVTLFFITGRGLHSNGLPRVKPACIKRLRERGLFYSECNPGLLRTRVTCDSKLTYQLS